jgi:hypothetical protein
MNLFACPIHLPDGIKTNNTRKKEAVSKVFFRSARKNSDRNDLTTNNFSLRRFSSLRTLREIS